MDDEDIQQGFWQLTHGENDSKHLLSSGQEGTKGLGVFIFPIKWGAKELLRVSQPSNSLQTIFSDPNCCDLTGGHEGCIYGEGPREIGELTNKDGDEEPKDGQK